MARKIYTSPISVFLAQLTITETQVRPQLDTTALLLGWLEPKGHMIIIVAEDENKLELSHTGGKKGEKWCFGNQS